MAKGLPFEQAVFKTLQRTLISPGLGLDPKHCCLFHGKSYFSRDRNSHIATDISIEVCIPGSESPAILWIWECKDYKGRIPVDDVEEFHAKLQQIGEDRTKGTIISSNAFQRSALEYARSKGIGVARLLPHRRIQHVLFHPMTTWPSRDDDLRQAIAALTERGFIAHIGGIRMFGPLLFSVASNGAPRERSSLLWYILDELRHWGIVPKIEIGNTEQG